MSGSTIGGVVGAVVGAYFGNPQLGWMIGSAIGGYVDPEQISGPRLQDARTQTSRDGIAIPFGWGTFPLAGNVIAQGPVVEVKKKERQGKGGPEVTTYTYTRTYAIGLCEGPITGILQVKRNGKVVYDARTDDAIAEEVNYDGSWAGEAINRYVSQVRAANAKWSNKATFYLGDETQMPDPALEAIFGAGNVPAHRGLAYFVVEDDDVTDAAGAIPQYEVVVAGAGTIAVDTGEPVISGARYPAFEDSAFPLSDPDSLYELTGFIGVDTATDASGYLTYTGSSVQDIISYFSSYPYAGGATRSPTHYLGYSAFGDGLVASIGESLATSGVSNAVPQSSVIDNRQLFLVYNDETPDIIQDSVNFTDACSFAAGGAIIQSRRGAIGRTFSIAPPGWMFAANCSGDDVYAKFPLVIRAVRKRSAPNSIDPSWVMAPDAPGMFITPSGDIVTESQWVENATTHKALTVATTQVIDSRLQYIRYETGPVLAPTDPNYSNATWWGDRYAEAVARGEAPAGLTYGSGYGVEIPSAWYANTLDSESIDPEKVLLATIVANVCERRGIVPDERDVSQLTDLVTGFVVGRETDAASIIQSLAPAYFFDPGEWDAKLRFIKRGGVAVGAINGDDLVERDGDTFERERVQEAELLRRVTVGYNDPQAAYALTTQKWERRAGTVQALGEASVELPLTLDADDAATIAKRRGLVAWGEPEKQKFSLPYRLGKYTPTDIVNYTDDDGLVHTVRLMDLQDDSGVRYVESSMNSAEAYGATATGVVPRPPSITEPTLRGPTLLAVMDLPLWRSGDTDTLGLYVAGCGYLAGWQGAQVDVSTDGGTSYSEAAQVTIPATIGTTTAALAAWASSEYPSVQTLTVTLPDAPESVSYEALLRYNNRAALQLADGSWEILQYQTVVANGGGSYTLSGLLRGRYATTPGAAAAGARFALLDAAVQFVPVERHLLGSTFKVRATTYGTSSDAAVASDFAFTAGASQTEWPVHGVTATRDGSDNVTVTWIGRARLGTETAPYHSANFTGYRVTYSDGQTFDVAANVTTHTRSGAPVSQTITVRPLNAITGAGPASTGITV